MKNLAIVFALCLTGGLVFLYLAQQISVDPGNMVSYQLWGKPAKEMGFDAPETCLRTRTGEQCFYSDTYLPPEALKRQLESDNQCVSEQLRKLVSENVAIKTSTVKEVRLGCVKRMEEAILKRDKARALDAQIKVLSEVQPQ